MIQHPRPLTACVRSYLVFVIPFFYYYYCYLFIYFFNNVCHFSVSRNNRKWYIISLIRIAIQSHYHNTRKKTAKNKILATIKLEYINRSRSDSGRLTIWCARVCSSKKKKTTVIRCRKITIQNPDCIIFRTRIVVMWHGATLLSHAHAYVWIQSSFLSTSSLVRSGLVSFFFLFFLIV